MITVTTYVCKIDALTCLWPECDRVADAQVSFVYGPGDAGEKYFSPKFVQSKHVGTETRRFPGDLFLLVLYLRNASRSIPPSLL